MSSEQETNWHDAVKQIKEMQTTEGQLSQLAVNSGLCLTAGLCSAPRIAFTELASHFSTYSANLQE
jgi:hypothetical protein